VHNTALDAAILISPRGMTLYHFTPEKGKKIVCTGKCSVFWPPLLIKRGAKPTAARGLDARKLGTIKRPNGRYQVTYAGFALYTFVADKKPGDVNGQGVEKTWYVIGKNGRLVKRVPAAG
jgi:predicted lipoprotein with Yx(FWY)xxD motif